VSQPHARSIDETRARYSQEEKQERQQQLQRTMSLLVHASGCQNAQCPSSNCNKVKALFSHAVSCTLKVTGGCMMCR
jgi:E1A/CREB-binding protein